MRICPSCSTWRSAVVELSVDCSTSTLFLYCTTCGYDHRETASPKPSDIERIQEKKRKKVGEQLSPAARKRLAR